MAVELKTIQHLCELSKLNYDEAGLEKVMGEMGDIIDLMDTIKSFDLTYDDTKDNNSISLSEVREDVAQPVLPDGEAARKCREHRQLLRCAQGR